MKVYGIEFTSNIKLGKNLQYDLNKKLYPSLRRANIAMELEFLPDLIKTIEYNYEVFKKDLEIKILPIPDYNNNDDHYFIYISKVTQNIQKIYILNVGYQLRIIS